MEITHSDEAGYAFAFDAEEASRLLLLGVAAHYGAVVAGSTVERSLSMTPATSLMAGAPLQFTLRVKILPRVSAPVAPPPAPLAEQHPDPTDDPVPDAFTSGTEL